MSSLLLLEGENNDASGLVCLSEEESDWSDDETVQPSLSSYYESAQRWSGQEERVSIYLTNIRIIGFIIQHIDTLPKYGQKTLDVRRST